MDSDTRLISMSATAICAFVGCVLLIVAVGAPADTVPWLTATASPNALLMTRDRTTFAEFIAEIRAGRKWGYDYSDIPGYQREIDKIDRALRIGSFVFRANLLNVCSNSMFGDLHTCDRTATIESLSPTSRVTLAFAIVAILAGAGCAAVSGYGVYSAQRRRSAAEPATEKRLVTATLACAVIAGIIAFASYSAYSKRVDTPPWTALLVMLELAGQYPTLLTQKLAAGFYLCTVAAILFVLVAGAVLYLWWLMNRATAAESEIRRSGTASDRVGLIASESGKTVYHGTAQPGQPVRLVDANKGNPAANDYTHGLCDCCDAEESICCCTCCAYPLMVAKAGGDVEGSYFDWFFYFVSAYVAPCLGGWFLRSRVQRKYGIQRSGFASFCASCCCPVCAAVQDIRESNARGDWDPRYGVVADDGQVAPNLYSSGACACGDDPESCMAVCCGCHSCVMGKAGGDVEGGPFDFVLCCVALVCPSLGMIMLRLRVRRVLQLGDRWTDSLKTMLCAAPCAICQDIREVKARRSGRGGYAAGEVALNPVATLSSYVPTQQQMTSASTTLGAQPVVNVQPYAAQPIPAQAQSGVVYYTTPPGPGQPPYYAPPPGAGPQQYFVAPPSGQPLPYYVAPPQEQPQHSTPAPPGLQ